MGLENFQDKLSLAPEPLKAYLVGFLHSGDEPFQTESLLAELAELCSTCGMVVVGSEIAKIRVVDPGTILGKGKLAEVLETAERLGADVVVTDDVLSPSQQRNWEKRTKLAVIDRQEVILDIFAARAQTREARLQVELAKANYDLPRLVRKWGHLNRQRGAAGGRGGRAQGEQQLELDSRQVRAKIQKLNDELAEVRKQRGVQRSARLVKPVPVIAIVGYTNAGKSSLLNRLTNAEVLVENKLFATLDPTVRRFALPGGQEVLLADTVGFVRKLPHLLIDAFKSTLEETKLADYILEVLDANDPNLTEHHDTTQEVLAQIGVGPKPTLMVFNKWDLLDEDEKAALRFKYPEALAISVKTGDGVPTLVNRIALRVKALMPFRSYCFPHSAYTELAQLRKYCFIEKEEFLEDGVHVDARVPLNHLNRWDSFLAPVQKTAFP